MKYYRSLRLGEHGWKSYYIWNPPAEVPPHFGGVGWWLDTRPDVPERSNRHGVWGCSTRKSALNWTDIYTVLVEVEGYGEGLQSENDVVRFQLATITRIAEEDGTRLAMVARDRSSFLWGGFGDDVEMSHRMIHVADVKLVGEPWIPAYVKMLPKIYIHRKDSRWTMEEFGATWHFKRNLSQSLHEIIRPNIHRTFGRRGHRARVKWVDGLVSRVLFELGSVHSGSLVLNPGWEKFIEVLPALPPGYSRPRDYGRWGSHIRCRTCKKWVRDDPPECGHELIAMENLTRHGELEDGTSVTG